MMNGLFSTLPGKSANERKLEIITNNIANAATPGYKAIRPAFNSVVVEDATEEGQVAATHVNVSEPYVQFSDAPLAETGNPLDLGIEGDGFFVVTTPGGIRYTRNGQFTISTDKKLTTQDGSTVAGRGGESITIEGRDVRVGKDGSVFVDKVFVDRIKVVDFANRNLLQHTGGSQFANPDPQNAEVPADKSSVHQGAYESSNVNVVREMVDMIAAVRAYETYSKVDQSMAGAMDKLIDLGKSLS
jgi:flagellar basal-body rod protein FlgG